MDCVIPEKHLISRDNRHLDTIIMNQQYENSSQTIPANPPVLIRQHKMIEYSVYNLLHNFFQTKLTYDKSALIYILTFTLLSTLLFTYNLYLGHQLMFFSSFCLINMAMYKELIVLNNIYISLLCILFSPLICVSYIFYNISFILIHT